MRLGLLLGLLLALAASGQAQETGGRQYSCWSEPSGWSITYRDRSCVLLICVQIVSMTAGIYRRRYIWTPMPWWTRTMSSKDSGFLLQPWPGSWAV
jgi:hypothetical protein